MLTQPEQAVFAAILVCVFGALLVLLLSSRRTLAGWLSFVITAASAMLVFSAVGQVLIYGPSQNSAVFWPVPSIGFALRLHVDGLTAVFLLLAAFIAVPAALYSVSYMDHYREYGVGRYYPYFLLFLAAMYGLLSTTDMMWFFFIFWQMMTLPGYALIRYEHRKRENIRAANKYLLMMQIACAATMLGAEMIADVGATTAGAGVRYDFDTVAANLPGLLGAQPARVVVAFALFLAGFGIKMGMWPFGQVWLPDAHPAAPSPVSAMLSGVMIKTGVYGVMRYFLWLAPAGALDRFPLANWGLLVATLGTITLFTGTMQALKQEQTKRLLAFHSIGQVGYILLGLGVCMAVLPAKGAMTAIAALALMGALFHTLNHGVFKALLFLNAGTLLRATGTQDLNQMGGLVRFMPFTAVTALIASLSISGVPLFNGFASKWSIYVAAVRGSSQAGYLVVFAAIAILTSALTLASFIKFFGASFQSRTSALVSARAQKGRLEGDLLMKLPQALLALTCVVVGVVPVLALALLRRALLTSPHGQGDILAAATPASGRYLEGLAEANSLAVFAPVALAVVLALGFGLAWTISRLGGSKRRATAPWLCGYAREADCHRYRAHGFYGEVKRHFHWLGGMPASQAHSETPGPVKEP